MIYAVHWAAYFFEENMTKSIIRVLDPSVVSMISASETIARPASIIKELVDNAIDSGATEITVVMVDGGKSGVTVTDNGAGMTLDDIKMSVIRHATSKLSSYEDLMRISSRGFRGEALASINAVASLRIRSCDGEDSYEVSFGRDKPDVRPTPRVRGTSVQVSDIFSNIPARRKFLRSDRAEALYSQAVLSSVVISNPDVSFRLINKTSSGGERVVFDIRSQPFEERVRSVMGDYFSDNALRTAFSEGGVSGDIYISSPKNASKTRTKQFISINGRPVSSPKISQYIRRGMGDKLKGDRHPEYVLRMSVPEADVDINAHPSKSEVALRHEAEICRIMEDAVRSLICVPRNHDEKRVIVPDDKIASAREEHIPFVVIGYWEVYGGADDFFAFDRREKVRSIIRNSSSMELAAPQIIERFLNQKEIGDMTDMGVLIEPFGSGSMAIYSVPDVEGGSVNKLRDMINAGTDDPVIKWANEAMRTVPLTDGVEACGAVSDFNHMMERINDS